MDDEALQNFVKDWNEKITPLFHENFPDLATNFWAKGIGTNNNGSLAGMLYYNSMEDYRKYYNENGTPTEKGGAAYAIIMPVFMELMEKQGEMTFEVRDWHIAL
jgi:hypothetical protein